ncbi:hypothetical protein I6F26_19950 [Ensifer sp. IC3342]|nr:hypothetical protein [Ensifer sp. BRP08]MCA1448852.1 hypothetical protein [Ensifer sp. IC3342]
MKTGSNFPAYSIVPFPSLGMLESATWVPAGVSLEATTANDARIIREAAKACVFMTFFRPTAKPYGKKNAPVR